MLNVVQVMCASLEDKKKIAVHCHAGLGRTGLSIACLLLYKDRMTADYAVSLVRENRPGSIQTKKQAAFVKRFELYLVVLRVAFPPRIDIAESKRLTLQTLMQRQRLYTHGVEQRMTKFVPRIVSLLLKKLIAISENESTGYEMFEYLSRTSKLEEDEAPKHVKEFEMEVNEDVFFGLEAEERSSALIDVHLYWLHSLKVRASLISISRTQSSLKLR
jgi:hypothetical protein